MAPLTGRRVLHVHVGYRQWGGEDAVVATERRLLAEAGDVVVAIDLENPDGAAGAAQLAVAPWNPVAVRGVVQRALVERVDVAHVHNTWFGLSPAVVSSLRRAGVPVVATLHNYRLSCASGRLWRDGAACTECLHANPVRTAVAHGCYRGSRPLSALVAVTGIVGRSARGFGSADVLVAPSEGMAAWAAEAGLPTDRVRVIGHAVPDPGERPAGASRPEASDRVLFVGRLDEGKGVDVLLEAWRALGPDPGLQLEVVGEGPERAALEATAPQGVRFAGQLAAEVVLQRLWAARAVVFPSTWAEPFGLVVPEALAAGVPLVATSVGAGATVGDAGWTVPVGDVEALATALRGLADDATVAAAAGHARSRWAATASPDTWVSAMRAAHDEAVAHHRSAR